jgi:hypothetical protein
MSALADLAQQRLGSMALLSRQTGISESLLRDFGEGAVQPDKAHTQRIQQVLGSPLPDGLFPHILPKVASLNVSEAKVLAVRDEHVVRPQAVKRDDLIRLVTKRAGNHGERHEGWVKVRDDARWERGDLVVFTLKDGSTVECHPAQTVTVARKRAADTMKSD